MELGGFRDTTGGVSMILDKWLEGELSNITYDIVSQALNELEEEGDKIQYLIRPDAYTRLIACITFLNMAYQQNPTKQPEIMQRLLNWIQNIKYIIDPIVSGIGGDGYSIGVAAPFGVSITVSFSVY